MSESGIKLEYENRFGRRGTRGIRPWLLIPKVIAVAVHFGALATLLILWCTPHEPLGRQFMIAVSSTRPMVLKAIVPSLLIAMLLGVALFLQHPRQFIRMRWLRVKLALVACYVPASHLFLSSRLEMVRQSMQSNYNAVEAWPVAQFRLGLAAAVVAAATIIILGRLKPRLGQNWARDYSAISGPTSSHPSSRSLTRP